jgi:hypothetical protein
MVRTLGRVATDIAQDRTGEPSPGRRPYARSWLNLLIDRIDGMPGPRWLGYAIVGAIAVTLSVVDGWLTDPAAVGTITVQLAGWGLLIVGSLVAVAVLNRIAQSALDMVRPLMTVTGDEAALMRYELTVAPAGPAVLIVFVAALFTVGIYVADPVASGVVGYSPLALAVRSVGDVFLAAVLLVFIYQAIRQLRCVARILDRVTRIDLFHPRPLYAFSRLTGGIGVTLAAVVLSTLVTLPDAAQAAANPYVLGWLLGLLGFAVAVFVVPLVGLHERLVAEKERLQYEADERLQSVLAALDQDVDALDLSRADGLNKTLASVVQQRDLLARLPTWPWSATTLRAFLSALLLPIVLFLIQRVLVQFV